MTAPTYIGNEELLKRRKVAFLAPSHVNPLVVMPTYDWVGDSVKQGEVIISGFYSSLEKDVWKLIEDFKGSMILVSVRKPYQNLPSEYRQLIDEGRLLIVFLGIASRINRHYALLRNDYICQISDTIVFPWMNEDSSLFSLYVEYKEKKDVGVLWKERVKRDLTNNSLF